MLSFGKESSHFVTLFWLIIYIFFDFSFIAVASVAAVYVSANFLRLQLAGGEDSLLQLSLTQLIDLHANHYGWALKFVVNCMGYACVFVPGILIYKYTQKIKYLDRCSNKHALLPSIVRSCFYDRGSEIPLHIDVDAQSRSSLPSATSAKRNALSEFGLITYCFLGLMISYLTWGLLQEKIMTQKYESTDSKRHKYEAHFKDSQFLVFANRFLAFIIATIYLSVQNRLQSSKNAGIRTVSSNARTAPYFKYSFASFSNIMSAWFQYEALKFVNFPTQVLAKSCKIIPVMLMGKIVSRAKYEFYEYFTAGLISSGMLFFLLGSESGTQAKAASTIASMTGILLLVLYMTFDSFTSNWQSDLFRTYKMSSIQMMCGVNLFSSLFTATSLSIQGGFMESISFASTVSSNSSWLNHSKAILFFFSIRNSWWTASSYQLARQLVNFLYFLQSIGMDRSYLQS